MAQGKYQTRRRRHAKRVNWLGIVICFMALILIGMVIVLMTKIWQDTDNTPSSTPGTSITDTRGTEDTSESTAESTTESTTEETTEETTESTTETTESLPPEYDETLGSDVIAVVESLIGKPYAYGSAGPDGFDTTGLIYYCFRECDIPAPRGLDEQFAYGTQVEREFLQPGDVVFFSLETPGVAEYVGIYTGNDTFIAVSSSRNVVEERSMSNVYFDERFVGARRYF